MDYDIVIIHINKFILSKKIYLNNKMNILFINHEALEKKKQQQYEFVNSFKKYSTNNIIYNSIVVKNKIYIPNLKLDNIDIICISWNVFGTLAYHSSNMSNNATDLVNKLKKSKIPIVVFIQDEYLYQQQKAQFLKNCNVTLAFVNIQIKDAPKIYNNTTKFANYLTGYIPNIHFDITPIKDRKTHIFYRGRELHYIYGDIGQDKANIGKYMKRYSKKYNLKQNIGWNENQRVYNKDWYSSLLNSKTTLVSESGCKVYNFEPRNTIIKNILKDNPNYSYEEAKKDFNIEPMYRACEVGPKIFEAIKLGTVLIMYEGRYQDIFTPGVHYIELKKDYSNIEDVIEKIKDDEYLQNMADRAYTDIIKNGTYTYEHFIKYVDSVIKEHKFKTTYSTHQQHTFPPCFSMEIEGKINLYFDKTDKCVNYILSPIQIDFIFKGTNQSSRRTLEKIIVAESDTTKPLVGKYNYIVIKNKFKQRAYYVDKIEKGNSKYIFYISNKKHCNLYLPSTNFQKHGVSYALYEKKYKIANLSFGRSGSTVQIYNMKKLGFKYFDYQQTVEDRLNAGYNLLIAVLRTPVERLKSSHKRRLENIGCNKDTQPHYHEYRKLFSHIDDYVNALKDVNNPHHKFVMDELINNKLAVEQTPIVDYYLMDKSNVKKNKIIIIWVDFNNYKEDWKRVTCKELENIKNDLNRAISSKESEIIKKSTMSDENKEWINKRSVFKEDYELYEKICSKNRKSDYPVITNGAGEVCSNNI